MAASFTTKTTIIPSLLLVLAILLGAIQADGKLYNSKYYYHLCPNALPVIRQVVDAAIVKDRRMGASLLRLHFHDCFVNGCDASVLLDKTSNIDSEKDALPNANSLRGFGVIDKIKAAVDKACGRRHVVSCADILAVAARDSVVKLGGAWWDVELGRRDSTNASRKRANVDLPSPLMNMDGLRASFKKQGLDETDLVALSGAHTIGVAQCLVFRSRLYNESATIDPTFANGVRRVCPRVGKNSTLFELDSTPAKFDTAYFTGLVNKRGLLHSDQVLFKSGNRAGQSSSLVKKFSNNKDVFFRAFHKSMLNMGRIKVLTGRNGQLRKNCRRVN